MVGIFIERHNHMWKQSIKAEQVGEETHPFLRWTAHIRTQDFPSALTVQLGGREELGISLYLMVCSCSVVSSSVPNNNFCPPEKKKRKRGWSIFSAQTWIQNNSLCSTTHAGGSRGSCIKCAVGWLTNHLLCICCSSFCCLQVLFFTR